MNDKELKNILSTWEVNLKKDPMLHEKVKSRIHEQEVASFENQLDNPPSFVLAIRRFLPYLSGITALGVIIFLFTLQYPGKMLDNSSMPEVYRQIVDPANSIKQNLASTEGFADIKRPIGLSRTRFGEAVSWLEDRVRLTPQQSMQFERIHNEYYDRFVGLSSQLILLENQYREFERLRISDREVNLLSVYDNLQAQKDIYQQALQVQQLFLNQIFQVLDAEQEGLYGEILSTPKLLNPPSARNEAGIKSEWQI